jgi:hypothetical protein
MALADWPNALALLNVQFVGAIAGFQLRRGDACCGAFLAATRHMILSL